MHKFFCIKVPSFLTTPVYLLTHIRTGSQRCFGRVWAKFHRRDSVCFIRGQVLVAATQISEPVFVRGDPSHPCLLTENVHTRTVGQDEFVTNWLVFLMETGVLSLAWYCQLLCCYVTTTFSLVWRALFFEP